MPSGYKPPKSVCNNHLILLVYIQLVLDKVCDIFDTAKFVHIFLKLYSQPGCY